MKALIAAVPDDQDEDSMPAGQGVSDSPSNDQDGDNDNDMDEDMQENEICVPMTALASPDESDTMVPPSEGDILSLNVEGRLTRVSGGNGYVQLTAVNGEKLKEQNGPPGEDDEEAAIRRDLGNGDTGNMAGSPYT